MSIGALLADFGIITKRYKTARHSTIEEGRKIIDTREPREKVWYKEGKYIVGIDNSTGDAWTESFSKLSKCLEWLINESEENNE